jgi:ATP-dependent Zn protease
MSDWAAWVANGIPIVILLGLWIFFMRRMKGSTWQDVQMKQVELMEAQLVELRRTNELMKKLLDTR